MTTQEDLSEAYNNLLDTVWNTKVHITTDHWVIYGGILNPGTVIRLHNSTSATDMVWLLSNGEAEGTLNGRWVTNEGYSCDVFTMLANIKRGNLAVEVIFDPHPEH